MHFALTRNSQLWWTAFIVAALLLVAAFPDVIFSKASLRITDQLEGYWAAKETTAPFPVANHTQWFSGANDTGGAAFQSEPMIQYMTNALRKGDSPYWNPYSAAGALGPDALVDSKFSLFTLVNAVAGGGSKAFNFTILAGYFLGVFFVFALTRRFLGFSSLAASAAGAFFLLNGYSMAQLGSNVTLGYPYGAVLLYTTLSLLRKPNAGKGVLFSLALAGFLSFTFMPTTIATLIGICVIALGYLGTSEKENRLSGIAKSVGTVAIFAFLAALLIAPIYLPIIANLKSVGTLDDYAKRTFFAIFFPNAIPSLFSPSLFFESYNAMEPAAASFYSLDNTVRSFPGNTVFHFGIVALILAGCCLSIVPSRVRPVILACAGISLFVLFRQFDPPILAAVLSYVPVIGNLAQQYWWACMTLPMSILVGAGIDNLRDGRANLIPAVVIIVTGVAASVYVWAAFGLHAPNLGYKAVMLAGAALLALTATGLIFYLRNCSNQSKRRIAASILVLAMCAELLIDAKMVRYPRSDFFRHPPSAIQFVIDNVGEFRTMNIGPTGLYPELGSAFGVQEISSTNQGTMPAYREFFYSAINLETSQRFGGSFPTLFAARDEPQTSAFDFKKLNFLGVKYILIPSNYPRYLDFLQKKGMKIAFQSPMTIVLENPSVSPRAFWLPLSASADVDLPEGYERGIETASITQYRNASVALEGIAPADGLVVLTDTWHSGWKAKVNGTDAEIVKVEGAFRGIPVKKGPYKIDLFYHLPAIGIGVWLAVASLVFLLLCLLIERRFSRRATVEPKDSVGSA
jgi:hypothetical protein